jgi:hypothetical protein
MLFNLAQTLRSFTTSPISTAVDQAHRMAQRRKRAALQCRRAAIPTTVLAGDRRM